MLEATSIPSQPDEEYGLSQLFKDAAAQNDVYGVYASIAKNILHKPVRVIREASEGIEPVILLENDLVLKFQHGPLPEEWGKRVFDCPILEQELLQSEVSIDEFSPPIITYYIQPLAEMATDDQDSQKVLEWLAKIKEAGWRDNDVGHADQGQLGWLSMHTLGTEWVKNAEGERVLVIDDNDRALVLVDYESVSSGQ